MDTEEIDQILIEFKTDKTDLYQARYAILRLFNIVGSKAELVCEFCDSNNEIEIDGEMRPCTICQD